MVSGIGTFTIADRVRYIQQIINHEEQATHRPSGSVRLVAVSKGHSTAEIYEAFQAGVTDFGESYIQEAQPKLNALATLPLCWHYIGAIQSNKTMPIAQRFSWVHSLARQKIAALLNSARPNSLPVLNVCLQVNLDEAATKSGANMAEVETLAAYVSQLPRLRLRGLMLIPNVETDQKRQYLSFLRLTELLQNLNQRLHLHMDTLSMGMSQDMAAAIQAGSTMVRIGTAIFGERSPKT